jgi:hypothetical protein
MVLRNIWTYSFGRDRVRSTENMFTTGGRSWRKPAAVDFVFVPRCPCPRPDGNGMNVAARGLSDFGQIPEGDSAAELHKPGATAGVCAEFQHDQSGVPES